MNDYIKRLVIVFGLGACFQFGYFHFLVGAGFAAGILLLNDIRDEL